MVCKRVLGRGSMGLWRNLKAADSHEAVTQAIVYIEEVG